ncbi:hypothetical protein [Neobacillus niacini]|uniref:hypothetical protein n=1 Tax=Neobacillus niacini TaxID=86668 RepID=UPI003000F6C4
MKVGEEAVKEMKVLYEGDANWGIPKNIKEFASESFSRLEIEYTKENNVRLSVPLREDEMISKFRSDVRDLLLALAKENSVLAEKLARYYKIKL